MSRTAVSLSLCTLLSAAALTPAALHEHRTPAARPAQSFTANPASTTFGVSTSAIGVGDADYRNLQGFYRFYPQGRPLSGFYVGGRGGVHRVSADGESGTFFGMGFELGYTWLLGSKCHFSVSIGIGAGATRLFGGDLKDVSLVVPTIRLINLGWAF